MSWKTTKYISTRNTYEGQAVKGSNEVLTFSLDTTEKKSRQQ